MKNFTKLFGTRGKSLGVILCAAFVALAFIGCSDSGSPTTVDPVVTGVTVSPLAHNVVLDDPTTLTVTFVPAVVGTGDYSKEVTWEFVSSAGLQTGTTISDEGVLTVAANETITPLYVKAISTANTLKFGLATVKIYATGAQVPVVTGVTIAPSTTTVKQGNTMQFTANVMGTNHSQDVKWSVNSSVSTISETGLLSVHSNESATSLTVTVTSVDDITKTATATVTVEKVSSTPSTPGISGTITDFNGDWITDNLSGFGGDGPGRWEMDNGSFTMYSGSGNNLQGMFEGTYSVSGSNLKSTITTINGLVLTGMIAENSGGEAPDFGFEDDQFYTFDNIKSTITGKLIASGVPQEQAEIEFNNGFANYANMMQERTVTYGFNSNKSQVTINTGDGNLVLTKEGASLPVAPSNPANLSGTWTIDPATYDPEAGMFGYVGELKLTGSASGTLEAFAVDSSKKATPAMKGTYKTSGTEFTATPTDVHGSFFNTAFNMAFEGMFDEMIVGEGGMSEAEMEQMLTGLESIKGDLTFGDTYYNKTALETEVKKRVNTVVTLMNSAENDPAKKLDAGKVYDTNVAPVIEGVFKQQPPTTYVVTASELVFYPESDGEQMKVVFTKK